jgi:putative NADH-flavin reductase
MKPLENRKLAVCGATGKTGLALIAEARRRGWRLRVLVRGVAGRLEKQPGVEVIRGDYASAQTLETVFEGVQAVVCVFGPRSVHTEHFCASATKSVIQAMQKRGIKRLLVQTGAMVGRYPQNWSFIWNLFVCLYQRQQPKDASDRLEQENLTRQSGLEWTIIKPPRLTSGLPSRVQAGSKVRVGLMSSLSRTSLAVFLMDEVEQPDFVGEVVFVKN